MTHFNNPVEVIHLEDKQIDGIPTTTCPVCKKTFVYSPLWVYRLRVHKHTYLYCSYTCYRYDQIHRNGQTIKRGEIKSDRYIREYQKEKRKKS